jgi:hypothetical protein
VYRSKWRGKGNGLRGPVKRAIAVEIRDSRRRKGAIAGSVYDYFTKTL